MLEARGEHAQEASGDTARDTARQPLGIGRLEQSTTLRLLLQSLVRYVRPLFRRSQVRRSSRFSSRRTSFRVTSRTSGALGARSTTCRLAFGRGQRGIHVAYVLSIGAIVQSGVNFPGGTSSCGG